MTLMNQVQMNDIRKDLNFVIDTIKHLQANHPQLRLIQESLGKIDNKLIDLQDAHMDRLNTPKPGGPFEIMINEYQRKLLERALHWTETSPNMQMLLMNEEGDQFDTKLKELEVFRGMLRDLPQINKDEMTHGFCL